MKCLLGYKCSATQLLRLLMDRLHIDFHPNAFSNTELGWNLQCKIINALSPQQKKELTLHYMNIIIEQCASVMNYDVAKYVLIDYLIPNSMLDICVWKYDRKQSAEVIIGYLVEDIKDLSDLRDEIAKHNLDFAHNQSLQLYTVYI